MSQDEIIDVNETIKKWKKRNRNVPKHYRKFFTQWILLNYFYNTKYAKIGKERDKISEFGRSYNSIFDKIIRKKKDVVALIEGECVGNGKTISPPKSTIKTATLQLGEMLGIENGCEKCRVKKRAKCKDINLTDDKNMQFEAILQIIYQIRCNFFHGDKVILLRDQFEKDKILIKSSSSLLQIILENIIQSN